MESRLQEYEARAATFDSAEQERRVAMLKHFTAINRFEGFVPTAIDERLFLLLATGKISKQEYMRLCLSYAYGSNSLENATPATIIKPPYS